jgi:hypothetical protein
MINNFWVFGRFFERPARLPKDGVANLIVSSYQTSLTVL